MPILGTLAAAVLALTAPGPGASSTVVVLPFENLSGVPAAREEVTAEVLRKIELAGYAVVTGAPLDEFLTAERLRYLDSLPAPERKKLLEHFQADAVVLGTIYSFLDGSNSIVAVAARMQRSDGSVTWCDVAGLSTQDTEGAFGFGRVPSVKALAGKAVERLLRRFPKPGESGSTTAARAKPIDMPGPRTYRSAALPKDKPVLVCILPLANRSPARVAPRVVGELLQQRLGASKEFRAVEAADFRRALVAQGIRVIRLGDPVDLRNLSKELGTKYFLQGTIFAYQDGSPLNASIPPVFELQLQLVDAATARVVWTGSLARKGTDYQKVLEIDAISNVVTLADQVVAEMISAVESSDGTGRRAVTATVVASDKVYDRSDAATIAACKVSGAPAADLANLQCAAPSATFADANAGSGKPVTATGLTLSGSAASRYVLDSDTVTATAAIRPKPVTAAVAAADKTYDGTPSATITSCTLSGLLGPDSGAVSCGAANASFADPNAGTGKAVTAGGITLSGEGSGNYAPSSSTATTIATIHRKPVTPEVTVASKTYDGTVSATLARCTFAGVLAADAGGTNCRVAAADFADANAGTDKPVKVTGIALAGAASSNYALAESTVEAAADIHPKPVEATIAAADKVYDGTTAAETPGCRLAGVIEADSAGVACEASNGAFPDKNVAAAKAVTAAVSLAGAAAGNYALVSPLATTNARIRPRALTVAGMLARNKIYDGTSSAGLDFGGATLPERVTGDDVSLDESRASGAFADKDAGTDKTVSVAGLALRGRDGGNYTLTPPSAHAAITPKPVEPRIAAADKVYDGTTAVDLTSQSLSGVLPEEAESVRLAFGAAAFDSKNVGTRTVTATALSLVGDASRNYTLPASSARTRATIAPKHVTGSFTVADKRFDGSPSVAVKTRSLSGTIPGDAVRLSGGRARFADAAVGTGKTVTLEGATLTGPDSRNYVLDNVVPTTADIIATRRETP